MNYIPRIALIKDKDHLEARHYSSINTCAHFKVVGTFSRIKTTLPKIKKLRPDAALIYLDPLDENKISLISAMTNALKNLRVMAISKCTDEQHVMSTFEAGASSYILEDNDNVYVIQAIKQLVLGGAPISPSAAIHLIKKLRENKDDLSSKPESTFLTIREEEVLQLMAKGFSYKEISNALNVSINTTRVYTKNLFHKLSVHSRGEAVYEAIEKGVISFH